MYLPPMTEDEQAKDAAMVAAAQAAAEEKRKQLQQQILANSAQQTEAGNANIGISMQGVQQLLNENPDNPFVQKLAKLMQGNPVLDQLASKSPADIEKAMRDQYWGAPKSKFGKIMQAIAKPLAVIGGAPTDFSGAAMKQYKDIQEMARRENRDDYLAAMAGSRSLIDLLKTKGSAAKTAATTGVSQVKLGQEGEKAVMNDETKLRGLDDTRQYRKEFIDLQNLREKLGLEKTYATLNERKADRKTREDIARMNNAVSLYRGNGRGGNSTSVMSKWEVDVNGNPVLNPSSVRTSSGGGGQPPMSPDQINNFFKTISNGTGAFIDPQNIQQPQQPVAAEVKGIPASPAQKPLTSTITTPNAPAKLTRTNTLTRQPWTRINRTAPERAAENFKQEVRDLSATAHSNLEQAYETMGLENVPAKLNRISAFTNLIGATNDIGDKSAQWRQISEKFDELPGNAGIALKSAAQAIGRLHSAVSLQTSGQAVAEPERKFIASYLPNATDFTNPYNFMVTMNKFTAATEIMARARDLGIETQLPRLRNSIERALNDYATKRANAFKDNDNLRKATGTKPKKLPPLDTDEVLWNAIQSLPDKESVISTFNLNFPGSAGEKATEQFQGTLDKAKVDKTIMKILEGRRIPKGAK